MKLKFFNLKFFQKKQTHAPTVGEVSQKTLHKNLDFTATEQYKLLRANLDFTIPAGVKCPVIGVTSAMRGEGKSTTAVNLSYVLAERGSKVLLIDGDLRIPSIAKKMGLKSSPGLTDILMGKESHVMSEFKSTLMDTWYVMPSGDIPPNPSELLGSKRMETVLTHLRKFFDYIIIDLPPVNVVSDATSISSLITGMVLVVREEYGEKKELERCFRQLQLSNVNILGCVVNGAKAGSGSYGKYKKYRYYKYSRYYYKRGYEYASTNTEESK